MGFLIVKTVWQILKCFALNFSSSTNPQIVNSALLLYNSVIQSVSVWYRVIVVCIIMLQMKIHLISTRAYPHDESSGCEIGIKGTSLQISFVSTKKYQNRKINSSWLAPASQSFREMSKSQKISSPLEQWTIDVDSRSFYVCNTEKGQRPYLT